MNKIFSQEEINTGRQREFDYLKGIFMLFIYLIHAFQATLSKEDSITQGIYMFATMSGAAIFIFVLGIGTVYSREPAPVGFVKNGIRMVVYQYLNNIVYVAALLLPYPFVHKNLSETGRENFGFLVEIYIQYTNIFFITGIIYLVLALLKKLNMKTAGYIIIGTAVSIAAPFFYGKPVNVPVLGYLVKLLIGEADFVSFTPLYFLSYALYGVAFGRILRHVKDKAVFYRVLAIPAVLAVIVWWALIFGKYGSDIPKMRAVLGDAYTQPNIWHVAASMAHIFVFAILFFFIERIGRKDSKMSEPKNPFARQILYYSRHISKYYALHVIVFFIALGINGYESFKSYQCWLLALLSIIVTEFMVRGYNRAAAIHGQ
ncbi:hypothetical protein D7V86_17555 [bacterium D16-51]|nr:hypothetical protein D7V96_17680 [bacterium D16-59]RKI57456.1 hypothetical protein D7V86_17555 [bacterium D16-51]